MNFEHNKLYPHNQNTLKRGRGTKGDGRLGNN